jgi:FAD:protein FMN transferase
MTGIVSSARFPAFGSTAVVMACDEASLSAAVSAVQRTVEAFDLACSRFREDSELSALNRAGGRTLRVSALLQEAVAAAVRAAELTGGDVDPSLGAALIALDYDGDFDLGLDRQGADAGGAASGPLAARPPGAALSLRSVPGWHTIRLDPRAGTVGLGAGVSLDPGATAKALAADHAAAAAHRAAGSGVLVGLGGDFASAGPAPPEGWRIRVTDDHRSGVEAPGQWITVHTGGLATSSTAIRRWRASGETVHHLLDPASGRPASSGWRTVSVAAASCLDANIASTAAIIRGEPALGWLHTLGLPSRLVSDRDTVVHVAGWPEAGDDLPAGEAVPGPAQVTA